MAPIQLEPIVSKRVSLFDQFSKFLNCHLKDFGAVVVGVAHVIVEQVEVCELFEVLLQIKKINSSK
jgi:hypothetical protein